MSSIFPYIPSVGALIGDGIRAMAQSTSQAPNPPPTHLPPRDAPANQNDIATALKGVFDGQPEVTTHARFSSVSITLNNGKGLDIDNAAKLISSTPPTGVATSLRGIEILNSATAKTVGEKNGLASSGLVPVWLENHGSITGKNGAGVKLDGQQDDEVINAGLIAGSQGLALDLGGGNDVLIVKTGGRFEGSVDGGSGTNQVILDDTQGGHFDGASQMQHLWVSSGTWTLTGAVAANQQGSVYSGATLINQSKIGGSMTVEPGATYAGGTVTNLDVAGTLQLDPAAHIENDLHMQKGSTLAFSLNPLKVGNTAHLDGATLSIQIDNENDPRLSQPLSIIDAKQIDGQFAGVTSNLKTLTPELTYSPGGVSVTFKRNEPTVA
jgi:hypothetical protein